MPFQPVTTSATPTLPPWPNALVLCDLSGGHLASCKNSEATGQGGLDLRNFAPNQPPALSRLMILKRAFGGAYDPQQPATRWSAHQTQSIKAQA